MSLPPRASQPAPRDATAPIDDPLANPRGGLMRSGSAMPHPAAGLRRLDHPGPEGLPPPEVREARAWRVSCDGGEGALGHPRVWLSIPHETGFIDCGYCDARFVHVDHASDAEALAARGTISAPGQPADHTQPADRKDDVAGPQAGE